MRQYYKFLNGLLLACICIFSMTPVSPCFSQVLETEYEIITIDRGHPDDLMIVPGAINDKAEVTGYVVYTVGFDDEHLPFVWKNGTFEALPFPGQLANAFDINNFSWISGEVVIQTGETEYETTLYPILWDPAGGYTVKYTPGDYKRGQGSAINDNNAIVGYLSDNFISYSHPFIDNGAMQIVNINGSCDSDKANYRFVDINNSNVAIGYGSCDGSGYTAFTWEDGIITSLPFHYLKAINNNGQIAATYGGKAVLFTDNIPYTFDNGEFSSVTVNGINDSGVMVGNAGSSAVMFANEQIIDLNTFVPPDSNIVFNMGVDINNKGDILVRGRYTTDTKLIAFILHPKTSTITYPALNDLLVAGQTDTIRWDAGPAGQKIGLEYTVDGGSTYRPINTTEIASDEGKYGWSVPDTLLYRHVTIRMIEHGTGDSLMVSDKFRIKPYVITRVGDDGEYEAYEFDIHRWGFGNNPEEVWPGSWWTRFDYQTGIDPFTNMPYTFYPLYLQFATAQRSDFPDWESFVNTFTVDACYDNPDLGYYNLAALIRWESIKHAWNGSCFGMAISNAVAFSDQDAFRTQYPGYPNYVNPVDVVAGPSVIPVISELFTYQYGNPFKAHDIERRANSYPTETVAQLKQLFSQDDVPVSGLALYNNNGNGGHEVLPYKLVQDKDDPEYYYIYIWDNSYPTNQGTRIEVDTAFNGNKGFWDAWYGFILDENWGGEKYMYVDRPATEFLSNPILAKPASPQEVFAVPSGRMEITTSVTASTLITDMYGNSIGSDSLGDIPDAYPLIIRNGSATPPYGYQLPAGDYTVTISDMIDDTAELFFFTEEGTFSYKRSDVLPDQTDRVMFNSGLSVVNPDAESKAVNLVYTGNGPDGETLFEIQSLILSPDDSVHVEPDADDRLILKSYGDATSYNVVVGSVSEAGIEVFEHFDVPLPGNTSHILVPDWTDDAGDQLRILIDEGNDGSVDDSLQVENQTAVEEQIGQAAPSGFRIVGNYPNPFNPVTTISYVLASQSPVTITIFTATGQQIASHTLGIQGAGTHEFVFEGAGLPSGVYLYQIDTGRTAKTSRMLLMK